MQIFQEENTESVILRAAMTHFSTYGFKRTSMEDIANEAMVSRPTLYAYFKNKHTILRAVSEGIHNTVITNINTALNADIPLDKKLNEAFWVWSQPFIDILFQSPHGAELIGANTAVAADFSNQAYAEFHKQLVKTLKRAVRQKEIDLTKTHLTTSQTADFLILSVNGLSSGETDVQTYKHRLQTLVHMFLTAVSTHREEPHV